MQNLPKKITKKDIMPFIGYDDISVTVNLVDFTKKNYKVEMYIPLGDALIKLSVKDIGDEQDYARIRFDQLLINNEIKSNETELLISDKGILKSFLEEYLGLWIAYSRDEDVPIQEGAISLYDEIMFAFEKKRATVVKSI